MDPYKDNQSPQQPYDYQANPQTNSPDSAVSEPLAPYVPPQPQQPTQQQSPASVSSQQPHNSGQKPVKSSKKGPLIAAIVGISAILILSVAVVVLGGGESTTKQPANQTTTNSQALLLQPAQPIDIEQINNAINQDLSTLNDEEDFPTNSLDDKTLDL